jgi:hypothetical protein
MDMKEIKTQKEKIEEAVLKVLNDFEIKIDCLIESIQFKRKHIDAGVGSRDVIDRVMIKISIG